MTALGGHMDQFSNFEGPKNKNKNNKNVEVYIVNLS